MTNPLPPPADEVCPTGPGGTAEDRAEPRIALFIRAAKLATPAGEYLCVIRDVSSGGVALRLFHDVPQCAQSILELQNGDRYPVALVWKLEDRAGFRFVHQADVARIIASPSRHPKRPLRLRLDVEAELVAGLRRFEVRVLDISQAGAKITCHTPLALDQKVRIATASLRPLKGRVRWRSGAEAGLSFDEPLGFEELALVVRDLQAAAGRPT